jgi:signal transduction histidine kinase/CheY-like chemotaxis protein
MRTKPGPSAETAELRRVAEARLREQHREPPQPPTEGETRRLLHELQVHQIQLEMQNEEVQRARNEMEAGFEKYSDLYDFAPVGYLTLDPAGAVQEANLASAALIGIERSRLLQGPFAQHLAPADLTRFTGFLQRVFASRARETCEVTLLRNGLPPATVRLCAAAAAAGRECRVVLEDITGQKQAEADRFLLNKLDCMGILASGLAHDFNNLLTVIVLNLELVAASPAVDADSLPRLEGAMTAALAARGLSHQLLTLAHGGPPTRRPVRLARLLGDAVESALSGSPVRARLHLAADLWLANVDEAQIAQVIRNLVLNAREAMPDGGVVTVRAENRASPAPETGSLPPGDAVRISVHDEGSGIAPEVLPKIFDPYFSTKRRGSQRGTGLGLAICHSVVRKHGGMIAVESGVGTGTTFHLDLPASRGPSGEDAAPPSSEVPPPGRILVMDDEERVRLVVGALLERMGHEVELVAEGGRALEVFGRARTLGCPFDAVILDLTVNRGLGGADTLRAMAAVDPAVRAIGMSGYTQEFLVAEPGRPGFARVLAKPFGAEALRQALAWTLAGGRDLES